nr:hypothetical protein [Ardenticatena sp.]
MTTPRAFLLFGLLIMLALAACSGTSPSEREAAAPAEPTATPMPTQAPTQPLEPTAPPAPTPTAVPTPPTPEQSSPPSNSEDLSGYEINLYEGNGFSIFYPPGAEARSTKTENGIAIVGPDVAVRSPDVDWLYEGPAYTFGIETFENAEGQDIETWTRNFLLTAWQQAKEGGLTPPEMYPVTEDGEIIEEALRSTTVRGQPAILVESNVFGFLSLSYYVPCGAQVASLTFQFDDEPAAGTNPLVPLQEAIYPLLKDGFWCTSDEAPSLLEALAQANAEGPQDETIYRLDVYRDENGTFGLAYPANAQLVPAKGGSGMTILGPESSGRVADGDGTYSGPAYALDIATFEMSNASTGYEAETWAREYVLSLWEEEKQQGTPTGSLPVSEDGVIDESRVGVTLLDGEPAFWVQYSNSGSTYRAFYFRCIDRIVQVGFREEIPANQPLADVQRDLYSLILNTFECAPPR